ncbi:CYTH domain-containing protein [Fenollaria massiliensis]|uniref:CYTH domain-containing protein n=1 Tax=Fenollaria massiliensis TaxID=938288 RepID=UPI00047913E2|nr:CYTH domain-containing protein [Fenollaria massiliensis]
MIEREKEVKVFNLDLDALKRELLSKGAEHLGEEKQVNHILKVDLDENSKLKSLLRLREVYKSGKEAFYLTYKIKGKDTGGLRNSEEITSEIKDKDSILKILEMLGVSVIELNYKTRDSYLYKDARFDFDELDKKHLMCLILKLKLKMMKNLKKS